MEAIKIEPLDLEQVEKDVIIKTDSDAGLGMRCVAARDREIDRNY